MIRILDLRVTSHLIKETIQTVVSACANIVAIEEHNFNGYEQLGTTIT